MPDETPTGAPVAPTETPKAADLPTTPVVTPPAQPAQEDDDQPIDKEAARKLRSENKAMRDRLRSLEAAQEAARQAEMTELEREKSARTKAEQSLTAAQQRIMQGEIARVAAKFGIVDPDVAATLISANIERDADGNPTNVEKLLRELVKSKPYLASAQQTNGAMVNPSQGQTQGTIFRRSQLEDLAFYSEHRAEIQAAMRRGEIIQD